MTKEEILEGNNLIAEFLNYEEKETIIGTEYFSKDFMNISGTLMKMKDVDQRYCIGALKDMSFHKLYDWLMPVVEIIENTKTDTFYSFNFQNRNKYVVIYCNEMNKQPGVAYQTPFNYAPESKIEAIWLGVVEFIKWHKGQIEFEEKMKLRKA